MDKIEEKRFIVVTTRRGSGVLSWFSKTTNMHMFNTEREVFQFISKIEPVIADLHKVTSIFSITESGKVTFLKLVFDGHFRLQPKETTKEKTAWFPGSIYTSNGLDERGLNSQEGESANSSEEVKSGVSQVLKSAEAFSTYGTKPDLTELTKDNKEVGELDDRNSQPKANF